VIVAGKPVERSAHSKPEADAIRLRLLEDSKQPELAQNHTTSVGELLDRWLSKVVKRTRAETTYKNYESAVRLHIKPYLGNWYLRNLTEETVEDWLDELIENGVGSRTAQSSYAVLHNCIEHAVKRKKMKYNPLALVDRPSYEREEIDPFTAAEVRDILAHVDQHRLCAAYHLTFHLGLRGGEVWGLQWSDINLDGQAITINRQACEISGKVILKKPKTKAGIRTLDIDKNCVERLNERKVHSLREGMRDCEFVFPNRSGKVMCRSNFGNRHWKSTLRSLGIRHRGFHHVRHTAATMMLKSGEPIGTVSAIIGHAKPSTTLDIYGHFVSQDGRSAIKSVSRAIGLE